MTKGLAVRMTLLMCPLLLAACGDDDEKRTSATATPTATSTVAAATTAPAASATPTRTATVPAASPTDTALPAETPTATPTAPPSSPTDTMAPTETPTATATSTPSTQPVANPTVEGPITGPGTPFIQAIGFDLSEVGYRQQEFFISGTATAYTNVGQLGSDGRWGVAAGTTAAYKTRILAYRPIDDGDFNGTVVVEWLNVSGGLDAAPDWISAHTELIREGYAWIGVSAQAVGVGPRQGPGPIPGIPDLTLKGGNPARYGSLNHPGDSFSYDMYSQVAQSILHPVGIHPLEGLAIERVLAVGESQSAFRMVTYVNAVHPVARLYDGFLIHSRSGTSAPLAQAPLPPIGTPSVVRVRDDLDVPVLTFQTETDVLGLGSLPSRQADTDLFRLWEVAGTAHADLYTLGFGNAGGMGDRGNDPTIAHVVENSSPIPGIIFCDRPVNTGPQHWVLKAAFAALERWVRDGTPPPTAPLLEVAGDPPAFVLDDLGNVRGGIRTSYVDAPVAELSGLGQSGGGFCGIFGTTDLFDAATIDSLYADRAAYVAAVAETTDTAVAAGFIVEFDGDLIKQGAETQPLPDGGE